MAAVPEIDGYSDMVRVAKGGFGVVYRAKQDRHGRVVALKVLDVDDLDDRARQRFERECVAMGGLSWHPNVVALLDSGITADGHPYLSMEYLDAGSLADRVRESPLRWEEVLHVGVQIAGALGAAHTAGTLHRDIKPENLLIGPFGETKVGDFGIAAIEGSTRTTIGHASFTAAYVAPEVLKGQRPDERSDLYSLAATFHTLLSGTPPFTGDPGEPFATLMTRILQAPTPRLPGVPEDLADLVQQTLDRDPDERPQTAEELGRRLQQVQAANEQPVTALRTAPTAAAGTGHAPSEIASSSGETITPPRGDSGPTVALLATSQTPQPPTEPDRQLSPDIAPTQSSPDPQPPSPPVGDGRRSSSRTVVAALVALVAVLALGLAATIGIVLGGRGSNEANPENPSPTVAVGTDPTTATERTGTTTASTTATTAAAQTTPVETALPDGIPAGDAAPFEGEFFTAAIPTEFTFVAVEDLSYGQRTEFQATDTVLRVETSPRSSTPVSQACQDVFESVADEQVLSQPTPENVGTEPGCSFEWIVNSTGEHKFDLFFNQGDRGYAVIVSTHSDPDAAITAARNTAATVRTA